MKKEEDIFERFTCVTKVNKKKQDPHEILVLLLSSDIECGVGSKLNFFESTNIFLKDIYEVRNLFNFPILINPTLKVYLLRLHCS